MQAGTSGSADELYLLADDVMAAVYESGHDGSHEALMRCFQSVLNKSVAANLPKPAMFKR